jgi:plastocyanin
MKKRLLLFMSIALLAFLLSILFLWATYYRSSPSLSSTGITHEIVLKEEGFSPPSININRGDTVKFISTANKPFWPASDLHPTHGIYPEFDPQEPIEPTASWEFTFYKTGSWKYHDHLTPYYRGTIIVK